MRVQLQRLDVGLQKLAQAEIDVEVLKVRYILCCRCHVVSLCWPLVILYLCSVLRDIAF